MNTLKEQIMKQIHQLHLPRYNEIPNVGLYLKQVVKYINEALEPAFQIKVTETMLSNYIKMHLVSNPIKKQYYREHISTLIFIVITKSVLSLDNLQAFLKLQTESSDLITEYDSFCEEFENTIQYVYGLKDSDIPPENEKKLMHNIILTVAHKFYLDYCFTEDSDI